MTPHPLSTQRVCPPPNQRRGGGVHTRRAVGGWGVNSSGRRQTLDWPLTVPFLYFVCALSVISILHILYLFMSSSSISTLYRFSLSLLKLLSFYPFVLFHLHQGVTRRCRLSWRTHSSFLHEPKCGGEGGVAGSQPMSKAVHRSLNKLWVSNSILCTYTLSVS